MAPKRYFEEIADEHRIKPGVLSPELRTALGLHENKLPIWIYRMRVLGYPPGWLKVADMSASVVDMKDGDEVIGGKRLNEGITYNPENLIQYPGFNTPVPEGVEDHCKTLGMPEMQDYQQLDFAMKGLKTPKPVPYKRIRITPSSAAAKDDEEPSTSRGLSQALDLTSDSVENDEIMVIYDNNPSKEGESPNGALKQPEEKDSNMNTSNEQDSSVEKPESEKTDEAKEDAVVKKLKTGTKLISIGSPVPESYKATKPPLEKWSENNTLADLIYFENLPNYTGVFDKMRNVLGNIRSKLFSSHNDEASEDKGADAEEPSKPSTDQDQEAAEEHSVNGHDDNCKSPDEIEEPSIEVAEIGSPQGDNEEPSEVRIIPNDEPYEMDDGEIVDDNSSDVHVLDLSNQSQ